MPGNNRPMLDRAKTQNVTSSDITLMVLSHTIHDNKTQVSLSSHQKRCTWKVALFSDLRPMEFAVSVDKRPGFGAEVHVSKDGDQLFPHEGNGKQKQAKMSADFIWTMPIRGKLKDLEKKGLYLVKPLRGADRWLEAVITEQHDDQTFDARAQAPLMDQPGKFSEIELTGLPVHHLRLKAGNARVEIPQRNLVLTVPANNPMKAILAVDDGTGNPETEEDIGKLLALPTPGSGRDGDPALVKRTSLKLEVSKDGQKVSVNAPISAVEHLMSCEARAVSQESKMDSHSWTVQLDPYTEHKISLERRHKGSNVLTLVVDGEVFVEGSGEELSNLKGYWKCPFRFLGEKGFDWNIPTVKGRFVGEQAGAAPGALAAPPKAEPVFQALSTKSRYEYDCKVIFEESKKDLRMAKFSIDDMDFKELPDKDKVDVNGVMKDFDLRQFMSAYRIEMPRPKMLAPVLAPPSSGPAGFFASCCGAASVAQTDLALNSPRTGAIAR